MQRAFLLLFSVYVMVGGAQVAAKALYSYPRSKVINISPTILAYCFMEVADQFPKAKASIGPHLEKKYQNPYDYGEDEKCLFDYGNFFDYLAAYPYRSCDYATSFETKLKEWILQQEDNNIDPVSLFAKSMELNSGDIFDSVLTIHQLLRNEARWMYRKYYQYNSSNALEQKFWNKFIDIRGDLEERGKDFHGDHQGTWYRIFGIILYRFAQKNSEGESFIKSAWANYKTSLVAIAAEGAKILLVEESDSYRKLFINLHGADIGENLVSYAKDSSFIIKRERFSELCKARGYLTESRR